MTFRFICYDFQNYSKPLSLVSTDRPRALNKPSFLDFPNYVDAHCILVIKIQKRGREVTKTFSRPHGLPFLSLKFYTACAQLINMSKLTLLDLCEVSENLMIGLVDEYLIAL